MNETPATEQNSQREGQLSLTEILNQIEQRANAATEEPWCYDQRGDKCNDIQIGTALDKHDKSMSGDISDYELSDVTYLEKICAEVQNPSDADFICAARSDVPALVKALRRATKVLQEILDVSYEGSMNCDCLYCGDYNEKVDHAIQDLAQLLSEQTGMAADSVPKTSPTHRPPI